MKKVLVFLLSMVLICSSVLLIACDEAIVSIKFKEDTVPNSVKQGTEIDYSKIAIIVTYENDATKEVKLTDQGVTFQKIDTSTTGNKTLSAKYGDKETQTTISVVAKDVVGGDDELLITGFANTSGYTNYQDNKKEQSNKDTEFFNKDAGYEVGNVNGYVLIPKVSGLDAEDNEFDELSNVKTTYVLYVKSGSSFTKVEEADVKNYLSKVENNVYYFTENAADHEFKIEVTLDDSYEVLDEKMSKTITQEIKIIGGGYNVYDALGLSVLDNLNNKSWADLKNTKLDWDDKKLSEYNDVELVILHNDITISKTDLPANYFWTKGEAAKGNGISYADAETRVPNHLKDLLEGSLKETCLGEDWEKGAHREQRALYVSTGIGLSGNYLKLSYNTGLVEGADKKLTAPNGGIYVVCDFNQETGSDVQYPECHYGLMLYKNVDTSKQVSATVSNVYLVGQTQKTENDQSPAGLVMAVTEITDAKFINTIGSKWFANISAMHNVAGVTVENCKFNESFSQMIYSWYGKEITIVNSELKNAGGPLVIIESPVEESNGSLGGSLGGWKNAASVSVDDYTINHMQNWLTGNEVWFKINLKEGASVIPQLLGLSAQMDSMGKHYAKEEGAGTDKVTKYNVLMVLIPDPSEVFNNQKPVKGSITINGQKYDMDDEVLALTQQLPTVAGEFVTLVDSLPEQVTSQMEDYQKALVASLKSGAQALQEQTVALPIAPIYKSGNNYGATDTENFFFSNIVAGVTQLQFGATIIKATLKAKAEEKDVTPEMAQMLNGLADQFDEWAKKVNPIAGLLTISANPTDMDAFNQAADTAWQQGWSNAPKFAAVWVNPGGLDATNPDFSLKPFMAVFGENLEA